MCLFLILQAACVFSIKSKRGAAAQLIVLHDELAVFHDHLVAVVHLAYGHAAIAKLARVAAVHQEVDLATTGHLVLDYPVAVDKGVVGAGHDNRVAHAVACLEEVAREGHPAVLAALHLGGDNTRAACSATATRGIIHCGIHVVRLPWAIVARPMIDIRITNNCFILLTFAG